MADVSKISKLRRATLAKKAIRRMADAKNLPPESTLWLTVILTAVEELTLPIHHDGPEAAHRYLGERFPFEAHADLAGVDPGAVRVVLRQAGLLADPVQAVAA